MTPARHEKKMSKLFQALRNNYLNTKNNDWSLNSCSSGVSDPRESGFVAPFRRWDLAVIGQPRRDQKPNEMMSNSHSQSLFRWDKFQPIKQCVWILGIDETSNTRIFVFQDSFNIQQRLGQWTSNAYRWNFNMDDCYETFRIYIEEPTLTMMECSSNRQISRYVQKHLQNTNFKTSKISRKLSKDEYMRHILVN